ncbi:MAG: Electron transport complex protein RnfG [uncultured Thiotrichaceae bacterium]|uniref:Ion-translocating oxidoreductase complex subunit G n=1 Tax=uncultured Thiotrichaceae bacterium TaxID=298394 RepID=A0A6S6T799_9GAMM|nr:MAG: Electron transport complex protein RnfG [uncultured Thiotrichaceae bacterium]
MNKELLKQIITPSLLLGIFALVGVVVLSSVHSLTSHTIAQNEQTSLLKQLAEVVDEGSYNNDLLNDYTMLDGAALGSNYPVTVYRARQNGKPVTAIFVTSTPQGYSGTIKLVVGVRIDKSISGVRVAQHNETPGLGDKMELRKSDWVLSFNQTSLNNPQLSGWKVKKDGGEFDQFTGATITPRAIVHAVKEVLLWSTHAQQFDSIFQAPSEPAKVLDNG